MARRKLVDKDIRSLTKVGNGRSYSITIPIEYITALKWRAKQKVTVKRYGDRIVIRDWKP